MPHALNKTKLRAIGTGLNGKREEAKHNAAVARAWPPAYTKLCHWSAALWDQRLFPAISASYEAEWETKDQFQHCWELERGSSGQGGEVKYRERNREKISFTQDEFANNSKAREENYLEKKANKINNFRWKVASENKEMEKLKMILKYNS